MTMPHFIHRYLRESRKKPRVVQNYHTGAHKAYPRMHIIELPRPEPLTMPLTDAMRKRESARIYTEPLSLMQLGNMLGHALAIKEDGTHRPYPSGGALFPIETYLIGTIDGIEHKGAFHYNPAKHALEYLWRMPDDTSIGQILNLEKDAPSLLIVFTSVWNRNAAKYGDFAYFLGVAEAGHMAQNIVLTSAALNLKSSTFGGFDDLKIEELLDIRDDIEQPVYVIGISA